MYASIKSWVNVPITIKPFSSRTAMGDKVFGTSYTAMCYPQTEAKVVRNDMGVEVVSNTHLYVDGSVPVTTLDNVVFEDKEKPIQAIECYYRNGVKDIKVVYL